MQPKGFPKRPQIDPDVAEGVEERKARLPRLPDDDFFCLRYDVWYPSVDCAFRTLHRSADGCLRCEQGRFNLKRHRDSLRPRPFATRLDRGRR